MQRDLWYPYPSILLWGCDQGKMDLILKAITDRITELLKEKDRLIIAIDGRCASGKTTLSLRLCELFDCNIIHMDDFFLRPSQRTPERLVKPGENIDHERFLSQVLMPLTSGQSFSYQPYSCKEGRLGSEIFVPKKKISVIEGSYSCHPSLCGHYDLRIFLSTSPDKQMRRIEKRNGVQNAEIFKSKWIPLEEKYFSACEIKSKCQLFFET